MLELFPSFKSNDRQAVLIRRNDGAKRIERAVISSMCPDVKVLIFGRTKDGNERIRSIAGAPGVTCNEFGVQQGWVKYVSVCQTLYI
jgi:hypothetical protein